MDKLSEMIAGLLKGGERFEKAASVYILILERKRKAQAEAEQKALKKAQDLEFLKSLSARVDKLYRAAKKIGLLDGVKTH